MYKRILIGVDGSPESMKALRDAVRLAKLLNATLDLLFVIPPRIYAQCAEQDIVVHQKNGNAMHTSLLQMEENELFDAIKTVSTEEGHEVAIHTRVGDAVEGLIEFSQSHGNDLIVVGSSGKGMAGRLILGSVSTGVVHQSHVAVLVVKPD
ncbi:MAG TPA: universal stress protein [Methanospirillum sp.]|uniref:universal stress protein n=1 Tax=Methanospirillum sp. TaxID=45200 RepID=UPI002B6651ED|nr:universal stress protein [Methanospirillum sp.]HWQ64295.1 universal stress protein [Methanospirillum sp.]